MKPWPSYSRASPITLHIHFANQFVRRLDGDIENSALRSSDPAYKKNVTLGSTLSLVKPWPLYSRASPITRHTQFCESERSLYIGMIIFFENSPLLVISYIQIECHMKEYVEPDETLVLIIQPTCLKKRMERMCNIPDG